MLHRHLAIALHRSASYESSIVVEGPRGGGKTTLLRNEFPGHTYVSLDHTDARRRAREDPEAFLARFRGPAIIDDLHRAPELVATLSHVSGVRTFVFASSRRLRLPLRTLELYPPTQAERQRRMPVSSGMLGRFVPVEPVRNEAIQTWKSSRSFLAHDVRDMVNVHDADRFEQFVETARRQGGGILDQQAIARECGISHRTANRWLGVLEDCFLILLLPASDASFGRRLVRRPKIHFLEDGPFESRVVSEIYRNAKHAGETPDLRYWRDSNGLEIPLLIQDPETATVPVGIAETLTPRELERLRRWMAVAGVKQAACIGQKSSASGGAKGILRYSLDLL